MNKQNDEKMKAMEKFASLLDRNKKVLSIIFLSLITLLIILGISSEIIKNRNIKSAISAELTEEKYETWLNESDEETKNKIEAELLDEIEIINKKFKGTYSHKRVSLIKANYYFEKKEWENAEKSLVEIANKYPKTYFAPISLMKAAIAAEHNLNIDQSINLYNLLINKYKDSSVEIPRAIFNLGRLYEEKKNTEEALKSYKILEDDFSTSNWTKLAINRIIYLSK